MKINNPTETKFLLRILDQNLTRKKEYNNKITNPEKSLNSQQIHITNCNLLKIKKPIYNKFIKHII